MEDDTTLARVLYDNFAFEGFEVETAEDGRTAIVSARSFEPDLVLLDLLLPDISGFEVCTKLRQETTAGIVMLTALGHKADKLRGLAAGADDYVTKPFDVDELLARVHAVLRRFRVRADHVTLGDVEVDFRALTAIRGRRNLRLSHREFALLQFLAERPEQVVSRHELLARVWGYPDLPQTRSVDHAIARIRKKIELDPHRPRFIHTVHGDGYCLTLHARSQPW